MKKAATASESPAPAHRALGEKTAKWEALLASRRTAAVLALLALALAARLIHLNRGMWIDELKTWQIVHWPLSRMLADRFREGHLPLYFLFMRLWYCPMDAVAWWLRLPSVAAGVGAVYLTLRLGEEGYAPKVAYVGAAILAFHTLDLWASQTARMYAILSCITVGASLQLIRLERTGRLRNLAGLTALSLLGLLTQALYTFVMLTQAAYIVWNNGRRALRKWKVAAALAAALAMVSPVYRITAAKQGDINPREESGFQVSIGRMFRYTTRVFFGDYDLVGLGRWMRAPTALCALVASVWMIAALVRGDVLKRLIAPPAGDRDEDREKMERARSLTRYIICWVGGYILIMFLFSNLVENKAGRIRYYTPIAAGMSLGYAAAAFAIGRRGLANAYRGLLAATLLFMAVNWWLYKGDGLREALLWIENRRAPGERVVGCNDVATGNAYWFYRPEAHKTAYVPLTRYEHDHKKIADLLRENTEPGQKLWLLVYHEKHSPLVYVARHEAGFQLVAHQRFRDAQAFCLSRGPSP